MRLLVGCSFLSLVFLVSCAKEPPVEEKKAELMIKDVIVTQSVGAKHEPWKSNEPETLGQVERYIKTADRDLTPEIVYTEPTVIEKGLGLHARAEGRDVIMSAKNFSQSDIEVLWPHLAIIHGPDPKKDLFRINPGTADLTLYAPLRLKPGEQATRRIPIKEISNVQGTKLVYYDRQNTRSFFVVIE